MRLEAATIPAELRALRQWVCWRYEQRGADKPTKVPYQTNGRRASSADPETWTTFGEAVEAVGYAGIGFVFADSDPYCGIDLDNVIGEDGRIVPWAAKMLERFGSYAEVSPSGRGVKLWVRGKYPGEETGRRVNWRDGVVEMYHTRRFFTVTGNRWPTAPEAIAEAQGAIDGLYRTVLNPPPAPRPAATPRGSDVVERCRRYIERCPDAISGSGGHDRTFHAACECARFGLSESETWRVMEWFNAAKCQPPWSRRELAHKIEDGRKKVESEGNFGCRVRDLSPPTIPIAPPPERSDGLRKALDETIAGKRASVPWPWTALSALARCLKPGSMTVLSGAAGASKSFLVSQACIHWLETGVPFAVFHLEEDREFHLIRALAQLAGKADLTNDEWVRRNGDAAHAAREEHASALDAIGRATWDAPTSDVSLADLLAWLRERCAEGRRVIVIDPVTAADSGREPWRADREFVLNAKRLMRESGASLIVVTHPRNGDPRHGSRLDNHAGGQAYNRFTTCVLALERTADEDVNTVRWTFAGTLRGSVHRNRALFIRKTRTGPGTGAEIAYWFDPETLTFKEQGVVDE